LNFFFFSFFFLGGGGGADGVTFMSTGCSFKSFLK
jgi:hypothetical protein